MSDSEPRKCFCYLRDGEGRYRIFMFDNRTRTAVPVATDDELPVSFETQAEAARYCSDASAFEFGLSFAEWAALIEEIFPDGFHVTTDLRSRKVKVFSRGQIVFELDPTATASLLLGLSGALAHLLQKHEGDKS